MDAMADTTPTLKAAPAPKGPLLFGRIDLGDPRTLAGLGVMAFCLGIMAGARLMRGAVPPTEVAQPAPCADCAERAIQEQRAAARAARNDIAEGNVWPDAPTPPAQPASDLEDEDMQHLKEDIRRLEAEDMQRAAATALQLEGTDNASKQFSPYAESVFPAEQIVSSGDSSVPGE